MAPEGAARGPVRYLPCRNSDSTVSFLSSAFFRRHRSPRSNHEGGNVPEEDARRGVQARLARVWSRARILPGPNRSSRDPHDPNHRHQCDTCRLSSAAFRLHHKMWPPHRRLSYFPLKNASRHFLTASPSPTSSPAAIKTKQRPLAVRSARAQELHAQDARHPVLLHRGGDRAAVLFSRAAVLAESAGGG